MDTSIPILSLAAGAVAVTAVVVPKVKARLELSRAKHRSLTGHSKMSRRVARLIPYYEFDINEFFRSDAAPPDVATRRQDGFFRLASLYQERFAKGRQLTSEAAGHISEYFFHSHPSHSWFSVAGYIRSDAFREELPDNGSACLSGDTDGGVGEDQPNPPVRVGIIQIGERS